MYICIYVYICCTSDRYVYTYIYILLVVGDSSWESTKLKGTTLEGSGQFLGCCTVTSDCAG